MFFFQIKKWDLKRWDLTVPNRCIYLSGITHWIVIYRGLCKWIPKQASAYKSFADLCFLSLYSTQHAYTLIVGYPTLCLSHSSSTAHAHTCRHQHKNTNHYACTLEKGWLTAASLLKWVMRMFTHTLIDINPLCVNLPHPPTEGQPVDLSTCRTVVCKGRWV